MEEMDGSEILRLEIEDQVSAAYRESIDAPETFIPIKEVRLSLGLPPRRRLDEGCRPFIRRKA